MGMYSANWEDEENNRIVELSVNYRVDNDHLELITVTPVAITFVDPQSKVETRKIKVWTETARRMLMDAYGQTRDAQQLQSEISDTLHSAV